MGDRLVNRWGRGAAAAVSSHCHTAAALARCALFLGNDTGTMHLAAAIGTPCVVTSVCPRLAGQWNPWRCSHGSQETSTLRRMHVKKVCDVEEASLLEQISVDEVVNAAKKYSMQ